MTRAAKIIFTAALLTGLASGAGAGFKARTAHINAVAALREPPVTADLGQYAFLQYTLPGPSDARSALQFLVTFLEQLESLNPARFRERDLAVAYTRLALVEDASNRPQESRAAMSSARRWLAAGAGGTALSEDEIKSAIRALGAPATP